MASVWTVKLLTVENAVFVLTKKSGVMGRLKKGCIHRQCIGGQPTSTTSSQKSSCIGKATTCVPTRRSSKSEAVSATLSQAILVQVYSTWFNGNGTQLSQGN